MRILSLFTFFACLQLSIAATEWKELPPIPDEHGVAGAFSGSADGGLVVAGGANFPNGAPWDGGGKVWHDEIYVLDTPKGEWKSAGKLKSPAAYGISISTEKGLICIGGDDGKQTFSEAFILNWKNGKISYSPIASLPEGRTNGCGALVGDTIYVFGGVTSLDDVASSNSLLSYDLSNPKASWVREPDLPAAGRILPVAGALGDGFYVFSGASLAADTDGKAQRTYLTDAWKFSPGDGWQQLADLPRATVAAPSPAIRSGAGHFLIVGGSDGKLDSFEPKSEHPGFTRNILAFDTITGSWAETVPLPENMSSPVTANVVNWKGRTVIASGEISPAIRTRSVLEMTPAPPVRSFGALNWTLLVVYLASMIGIGYWFMKKEAASSTDAYFRGGQRVPAWVAGLSIFATTLSSLTFMGIPARAFQTDISWYIGQLPILIIVPMVVYFYLPFFRKLDLTSAYEFLENRFNIACRLFGSFSFILFHIGRIAIVLYLPAVALAAVSDIGVDTAILIIGVLCIIYTVMGGIEAVVWTDAIQAIVLMGGAVLCFVIATSRVDGGFGGMMEIASQDNKLFQNVSMTDFSLTDGTASFVVLFIAFFFNSLVPYTSSQDVVQRYVTTPDIASARKSLWITMWLSIFGSLVFFGLGIAIYAFFKTHPETMDPNLPSNDAILPFYILQQLPKGVSGLVIAAIFAASQSTISSSLNSVATCWIKDVDQRLLRKGRTDQTYLKAAKWVVLIIGTLGVGAALWMAHAQIESAFKLFNTFIGLTAGALGGLFALGVFTKRTNGVAALTGAICGFVGVLVLHLADTGISGLLYAFIGFTLCFVTGWLLGLVLPASKVAVDTK